MAVILDTDLLPERDRADAVGQAMQRSGIPARITHEPPPDQIYARIKLWQLGGGTTLMHRDGSGVCLTRTSRQVRVAAPERFSVTVLGAGRWTYYRRAAGPTGGLCAAPDSGDRSGRPVRVQPHRRR